MKEVEERICTICGMKFKTNDGRVKTCHRHKARYNGNMNKKVDKAIAEAYDNKKWQKYFKRKQINDIAKDVCYYLCVLLNIAILVAIIVK